MAVGRVVLCVHDSLQAECPWLGVPQNVPQCGLSAAFLLVCLGRVGMLGAAGQPLPSSLLPQSGPEMTPRAA